MKNEDLVKLIEDKFTHVEDNFTNIEVKLYGVDKKVSQYWQHTVFQYILLFLFAVGLAFFNVKIDDLSKRIDSVYMYYKQDNSNINIDARSNVKQSTSFSSNKDEKKTSLFGR